MPEAKREGRWRPALDLFHEADARLAAAAHGDDEGLYDRLGARHDAAVKALLRTPAPTLPLGPGAESWIASSLRSSQ